MTHTKKIKDERASKPKCECCGSTKKLTEINDVEGMIFLCKSCIKNNICESDDGNEMCDSCNCWKHTREVCG